MPECRERRINVKNQFIQGLTIDWAKINMDSYLRKIDAIKDVHTLTFNKPVTFFFFFYGSGKSTMLEAIAVAYGFNPEGGTKNYSFSTYDSHSELCDAITIIKGVHRPRFGYFLRAESFYNVATKEQEYADIDHPSEKYHEKSHGESFLAIAQNYMKAGGIYIFDEPEAGIDLWSFSMLVKQFEKIHREKRESLVLISHQERIIRMADRIMVVRDGRVEECGSREESLPKLFLEEAECTCMDREEAVCDVQGGRE